MITYLQSWLSNFSLIFEFISRRLFCFVRFLWLYSAVAHLAQPHFDFVNSLLKNLGLDSVQSEHGAKFGVLRLSRTLYLITDKMKHRRTETLRSKCFVNGEAVSLKSLKLIASIILTTVDAAVASTALNRQSSRLAVVDHGVPGRIKAKVREARRTYRYCRDRRKQLQDELSQRVLPSSFTGEEENTGLLMHWIHEFDVFEKKMKKFRLRLTQTMLMDGSSGKTALFMACKKLASAQWIDASLSEDAEANDYYSCLLDFLGAIKLLESQLKKSNAAHEALAALSAPNSAISAVERARKNLIEISPTDGSDADDATDPITSAVEKAHDLLNAAENAIYACAKSIDADGGIFDKLECMRKMVPAATEEIDWHIGEWNALARKHGVSPYKLVKCQKSLREEHEGTIEAKTLMPVALVDEEKALEEYIKCCSELTEARRITSARLSEGVTNWLPHLGMEGHKLIVQLREAEQDSLSEGSISDGDKIDFVLLQGNSENSRQSGSSDFVASSGEKARLLLALETVIPGSIGASCGNIDLTATRENSGISSNAPNLTVAPVAVLYDEIDAHVGGRAVVAVGKMLSSQSRSGGQVISITHSASVAALADKHLVIDRQQARLNGDRTMAVQVTNVSGAARRKELARMTSGDMAMEEAEAFADALMREREYHIQ